MEKTIKPKYYALVYKKDANSLTGNIPKGTVYCVLPSKGDAEFQLIGTDCLGNDLSKYLSVKPCYVTFKK